MNNLPDAWFPNLGIKIYTLPKVAFNLFGIDIYFYAIFILIGTIIGLNLALKEAKNTGQDPNLYYDFFSWAFPISILGARFYYVIFSWDLYRDNPISIILGIREGGLAIYGGVISSIICLLMYCKIKKENYLIISDTCAPSLILGQAIGRWGNFTNREAFGKYTNCLFALRYKLSQVHNISKHISNNKILIDKIEYIQVHPTFLYESAWNILIFIFLMLYRKQKKFNGEVSLLYFASYGLGRFFIEDLRTDQLLFYDTSIAVSKILSLVLLIISLVLLFYKRYSLKKILK